MAVSIYQGGFSTIFASNQDAMQAYTWTEVMTSHGFYGSGSIVLFEGGCSGNLPNNCTAVCADAAAVWADRYGLSILTLHNCMLYPIISQLYRDGSLTSDAMDIADAYGIDPYTNSSILINTSVISDCVKDLCMDTGSTNAPGCSSSDSSAARDFYVMGNNDSREYHFELKYNPHICENVTMRLDVNLDIAGIGMLVAYIFQACSVILACVLWHCLQDWGEALAYLYFKLWKRSKDRARSAARIREKIKRWAFYESFVKALAEFQKAQVFLMLAVQVAALIALYNPDELTNDTDRPSQPDTERTTGILTKNLNVLIDLAFAGSILIMLGLLVLRNAGKRDTYTLVVTTFPMILAVIILISTGDGLPDLVVVQATNGPDTCAGVNPTDYCFNNKYTGGPLGSIGGGPIAFCFIVELCIALEHVKVFRDRNAPATPQTSPPKHGSLLGNIWRRFIPAHNVPRWNCFEALRGWILRRRRLFHTYEHAVQHRKWLRWLSALHLTTGDDICDAIGKATVLAAEITFCGFCIVLLREYAQIIRPKDYPVSDFQYWTLGQVIAVTVFFPVLIEFIWDCYAGVAKTIESRILPDTYRVVKVEDSTAAPTSNDDASEVQLVRLPSIGPYEPLPDELHHTERPQDALHQP